MTDSTIQTISCPGCGHRFAWKAEWAGRRLACDCGKVFEARLEPDGLTDTSDPYDLVEEPPAPAACGSGATAPANPRRVLAYEPKPAEPKPTWRQRLQSTGARALYIPLALLVVGGAFRLGQIFLPHSSERTSTAILMVALWIVMQALVMFCGVLLAAQVLGVEFGPTPQVMLKLCAAVVVASIAGPAVASLDRGNGIAGMLMGWYVVIMLYWAAFYIFFDLDFQEIFFTVAIVGALQAVTACVLWRA